MNDDTEVGGYSLIQLLYSSPLLLLHLLCIVVAKAKEEFAKYRDVKEAVHQYEGRLAFEDDDARMKDE